MRKYRNSVRMRKFNTYGKAYAIWRILLAVVNGKQNPKTMHALSKQCCPREKALQQFIYGVTEVEYAAHSHKYNMMSNTKTFNSKTFRDCECEWFI